MAEVSNFEKLKSFLESKPASQKAVQHLKRGVEIAVVIGHQIECTLFNEQGQPRFEKRPAKNPDVIFFLTPEAIETLVQHPGDDVGDFGITVVKQYLEGAVSLKAPGSLLNLTMNGYLGIMKEGGPTFTKYLATRGVSGISKVFTLVKNLKS